MINQQEGGSLSIKVLVRSICRFSNPDAKIRSEVRKEVI